MTRHIDRSSPFLNIPEFWNIKDPGRPPKVPEKHSIPVKCAVPSGSFTMMNDANPVPTISPENSSVTFASEIMYEPTWSQGFDSKLVT